MNIGWQWPPCSYSTDVLLACGTQAASDSQLAIYTIFVLGTIINAMVNLKQSSTIVLICVETNWLCSEFAMVLLDYRVTCNYATKY